jgi:4-hydroxybenzoate polyprenyltransferase/phosphoserine phosphatase
MAHPHPASGLPLCADLDGTLLRTDTLHESIALLLRHKPWLASLLPLWLLKGKAWMKRRVAAEVLPDATLLPAHEAFVEFLKAEHAKGRRLLLVTAADARIAEVVAKRFGLFEEALASDGVTNLSGSRKASALVERFGKGGFAYAGNSWKDLPVWREAGEGIVVNASAVLERAARKATSVTSVFPPAGSKTIAFFRAVRPRQWLKNLLVFVPALTGHTIGDQAVLSAAVIAFVAFSLAASSAYLVNDALDAEADRRHPDKRNRPTASGDLSPLTALLTPVPLLAASLAFAWLLPNGFGAVLLLYAALTLGYSLFLKRFAIADVSTLACLYTIRIVAGGIATATPISSWLLAFSMFLFFSLALAKRCGELHVLREEGDKVSGRGYRVDDRPQLLQLGVTSGYMAVLVFTLYINSTSVAALYRMPTLLWGIAFILFYWISRLWLLAHRGRIREEPLEFALRDPQGYLLAAVTFALLYAAT